jgi:HAD superfamily hydrolase (TIGR01484 family)
VHILLCTDMDRTVVPNGEADESPQARPRFRAIARRPEVTLACVTGRHEALIHEAIDQYDLPVPDYAIGDVGTTIYEVRGSTWEPFEAWAAEIAPDWRGMTHDELAERLTDVPELRMQEAAKQNRFKLSYYAPADTDRDTLLKTVRERLSAGGVRASLIWSIDEPANVGLLDVLPERATKLHAIRFLMRAKGFDERQTVFAGDSGNDLPALTSGLQAVLVRNAADRVRDEAVRVTTEKGLRDKLYRAGGEFMGMNGNYAAGVLEGLVHFLPETGGWISSA